jgi:hypothetical protein
MTIQNAKLYMEGIWDWDILKGCFGDTKIEPTDIDGFVERKGKFLVLETKKPGVKINQGQWFTFNALINTGVFTVVIIWGLQNMPEEIQVLYPLPKRPTEKKKGNIDDLRNIVSWWFKYANTS